MPRLIKIISLVFGTLSIGFLGSIATFPTLTSWYIPLHKPFFTPPNWLFGPAWTILYILMGIAAGLVWSNNREKKKKNVALQLYGVQLGLNLFWSILFFGLHLPAVAFVEILFLWLSIVLTMQAFYRVNVVSGYLFIPYICWVSFALILNFSIVLLNPQF